MKKKCLKFGQFEHIHLYLLLGFVFDILLEYLIGSLEGFGIPLISYVPFDKIIYNHSILFVLLQSMGLLIFGLIFYRHFDDESSSEEIKKIRENLESSQNNSPIC